MTDNSGSREHRLLMVGAVGVLVATLMGVISGTRPPSRPPRAALPELPLGEPAKSYSELREGRRGNNAAIYAGVFARLDAASPQAQEDVSSATEEERATSLEARAARRAFAGAPPVVPHAIDEMDVGACLTCHEKGLSVGGRLAPAMSHRPYAVCVQCHAAERKTPIGAELPPAVSTASEFTPLGEPGSGDRAWEGAPPVIPHPTLMRDACNSCHGPRGSAGLRTPHPRRENCEQCHAPSAPFEQQAPPPWLTPPPIRRAK